jgi:hypothetical protein
MNQSTNQRVNKSRGDSGTRVAVFLDSEEKRVKIIEPLAKLPKVVTPTKVGVQT